ncbi:PREDICTED: stress-response A/B barrel domain-containing protein UP3-like [Nelumbo nucifera]|uniref:Stress-response A/B barrel domain-containing protein UP3-like n=1 Tax=Nelumbo nucifera TaxID=4432 RepID=A0A1U8B030_NELNU|nr:PREDICTED: stress-response A/B barrel domain-containing protein UP3-like [Nelumbo nucifera]
MLCVSARPFVSTPASLSPPNLVRHPKPSFPFKSPCFCCSSPPLPAKMQTVEHVVLFKVKDNTEPSKVNAMISRLNGLTSLDQVLHLSAGPIYRNRSSAFSFTHLLHSRYRTKEDLSVYSAHPNHLSVVEDSVLPICEDIMAIDWVADDLHGPLVPRSGAAMRVTFLKLKEGLGNGVKGEVLRVLGGIRNSFASIDQISFGENFSLARAKGFSIASLAIFPGLTELHALDSNVEAVKAQKEKVKDSLESVIVVDYVFPPPKAANL